MPTDAAVLRTPRQPVLIATTERGAEQARKNLGDIEGISYLTTPGDELDLPLLVRTLRAKHGVTSLLSEGGATVYGALVQAGVIDDEFLTVSPIVVGNPPPPVQPRTSLIEGVGFDPEHPPEVEILSLRRVGSYLFQRSRYRNSPR